MLLHKCVPGSRCPPKWSPETTSAFGAYWRNASAWWVLICFLAHLRGQNRGQTLYLIYIVKSVSARLVLNSSVFSVPSHILERTKNSPSEHQNMSYVSFFLLLQLGGCNGRKVSFIYDRGFRILMFWVFTRAGIVQNSDASRVQRAVELPPENLGVHGTHPPHPQGLRLVWLNRSYAGITVWNLFSCQTCALS